MYILEPNQIIILVLIKQKPNSNRDQRRAAQIKLVTFLQYNMEVNSGGSRPGVEVGGGGGLFISPLSLYSFLPTAIVFT